MCNIIVILHAAVVADEIWGDMLEPARTSLAWLSREGFSTSFPRRLASNCAYARYIMPVGALDS